ETFGEGMGSMRIAHSQNGADQLERLETFEPERHLYCYTMQKTSMPVRNYIGEFRIDPADDGASVVVWSAEFELTANGEGRTVESVRRFLHTGTEALKRKFS